MKKLLPLIISSILLVGAVGCQENHQDAARSSTNNPTSQASAKPASQTTDKTPKDTTEKTAVTKNTPVTTKSEGALKSEVVKKLKAELPNNKLEVEAKAGNIVIKGTATSNAELKKAEKLVKEVKGVKSVKVEAKVLIPNKI
ncbi:BON domain-containing protein [Nostoc sp. FACHB-87]|uniref:BON domain-containing protein n=1 Tax=Nostocales TaxID=1161 RepID=UPI00168A1960|nr:MULTISPECIES: BON domain-containing protein [Nostocales]MBD2454891.1 BON domain-containing protein [Nostoc sp. FACHB-87]MBD2476651.1 BON domain-containing protein [Anabaena sp. FACHB-83]MBD2487599.1 BON domain-containing protein [Aulosira sp. FACHB-615]